MASQDEPPLRVAFPGNAEARLQLTLRLRRRKSPSLRKLVKQPISRRKHLTSEQFDAKFGAHPEALNQVRRFAARTGLRVEQECAAASLCVLEGSVAQFSSALPAALLRSGSRSRALSLPPELTQWVLSIHGLDRLDHGRQRTMPQFKRGGSDVTDLTQLAQLYRFPTQSDGAGETIALLHFGQGYLAEDLRANFNQPGKPTPEVTHREVLGGRNRPASGRFEPTLDMVVAAKAAPGARIVHYFAEDTSDGWIHAFAAAIHDREHRPSILSVSWGAPEMPGDPAFYAAVNDQLRSAALLGITVCCATGNQGASADGAGQSVNFPASSPYVLAVGGTELWLDAEGAIREVAWNQGRNATSGGGMSRLFRNPSWQREHRHRLRAAAETRTACSLTRFQGGGSRPRRRTLPDVSAHAAGINYLVTPPPVSGKVGVPVEVEASGTSAATPFWAALIARINGALGRRVGLVTPLLYRKATAGALRDVRHGHNGAFFAGAGWNACTGLGSPDGERLVRILRSGISYARRPGGSKPAPARRRL